MALIDRIQQATEDRPPIVADLDRVQGRRRDVNDKARELIVVKDDPRTRLPGPVGGKEGAREALYGSRFRGPALAGPLHQPPQGSSPSSGTTWEARSPRHAAPRLGGETLKAPRRAALVDLVRPGFERVAPLHLPGLQLR